MAAHPTYRRFLVNDSMMALNAAIRRASTDNLRVREGRFLDADTTREQLQDLYDQIDGAQDPWLAERVADLIRRANRPWIEDTSKWLFDNLVQIETDHFELHRREMDDYVRRERGSPVDRTPSPPLPHLSDDPIHLRIPATPDPEPEPEPDADSLQDVTSPEEDEEDEEKAQTDAEETPSQMEDYEWAQIAAVVALQMARLVTAGRRWREELHDLRQVLADQRQQLRAITEWNPRQADGLVPLDTVIEQIQSFLPADARYNPMDRERLRFFLRGLIDSAGTEGRRLALWGRIRPYAEHFQ